MEPREEWKARRKSADMAHPTPFESAFIFSNHTYELKYNFSYPSKYLSYKIENLNRVQMVQLPKKEN